MKNLKEVQSQIAEFERQLSEARTEYVNEPEGIFREMLGKDIRVLYIRIETLEWLLDEEVIYIEEVKDLAAAEDTDKVVQITDRNSMGKVYWRNLMVDGKTSSNLEWAKKYIRYYENHFIKNVQIKLS